MALPRLRGHRESREMLSRALRGERLPQSILLHGPAGVGKERLGLWLAQMLVCEAAPDSPCEACSACRLAERLEHPDVHWFFPLPRPEGTSSADRLQEKLEDARFLELQRRREEPFQNPGFEKPPAHFLASIRTVQRLAGLRPALGQRKVFVIGDAELMVPQESSQEAANAFLKLLEEPPAQTTLILTSSQPGALLPTILSRVLSIRIGLVEEMEIAELLQAEGLAEASAAGAIARRARGSVRRAVEMAARREGAEAEAQQGKELLLAALATAPVSRLGIPHAQRPTGGRGELTHQLDSLMIWLRDLLAVASGATQQLENPEALSLLQRAVEQRHIAPGNVIEAIGRVTQARELAQGNLNPQLILADLLKQLSLLLNTRMEIR